MQRLLLGLIIAIVGGYTLLFVLRYRPTVQPSPAPPVEAPSSSRLPVRKVPPSPLPSASARPQRVFNSPSASEEPDLAVSASPAPALPVSPSLSAASASAKPSVAVVVEPSSEPSQAPNQPDDDADADEQHDEDIVVDTYRVPDQPPPSSPEQACAYLSKYLYFDRELLPVALAAQPGSGSSWLRLLVQTATGALTGSYSVDQGKRMLGLYGEGILNRVSLVHTAHPSAHIEPLHAIQLKLQQPDLQSGTWYPTALSEGAVVLVRHPLVSILSSYNATMRKVTTTPAPAFSAFAQREMERWIEFYTYWTQVVTTAPAPDGDELTSGDKASSTDPTASSTSAPANDNPHADADAERKAGDRGSHALATRDEDDEHARAPEPVLPLAVLLVKFEDLLAEPAHWLRAVVDFLGFDFDPHRFRCALDLFPAHPTLSIADALPHWPTDLVQTYFGVDGAATTLLQTLGYSAVPALPGR